MPARHGAAIAPLRPVSAPAASGTRSAAGRDACRYTGGPLQTRRAPSPGVTYFRPITTASKVPGRIGAFGLGPPFTCAGFGPYCGAQVITRPVFSSSAMVLQPGAVLSV